ncbi:MAG: phosphoribosylformylglycinamidine synthase [Coxiellaceae bacterium]|nr:phosphoribosylformylglycinamidine synthase [Coxiellaceae bacterium]
MLHLVSTQAVSAPELSPVLGCETHFFLDLAKDLTPSQENTLAQLLGGVKPYKATAARVFIVVPRFGTISPWSSKAADILHVCGLTCVNRLERALVYFIERELTDAEKDYLYDRMTESYTESFVDVEKLFTVDPQMSRQSVALLEEGKDALHRANIEFGLALSLEDISYLNDTYSAMKKNPTLSELMMFAQVNSEHCRHKIFNANWTLDGVAQEKSLFAMIKNTYQQNSDGILSAYHDNDEVLLGHEGAYFYCEPNRQYKSVNEAIHTVIKVETHNHPTAISPFPGAATGSGGEIRDEAATGRGARTKMGLTGFSVAHLQIPDFVQPWETSIGKPAHMASALEIMLEGPIGGASFNNEFGRPNLCGYFRTFGIKVEMDYGDTYRGYHKPIMIAGGVGNIRDAAIEKKDLPVGAKLIVLGGPAMAIGLGGGAASSRTTSDNSEALDFASVQRSNPEMQRRCQEVIDACWVMGDGNPILSIHDVGAGGLSNALPELVEACDLGATIQLREIPNAAPGMTPMEIWCNEAQERYVLSIMPESVATFTAIAERERCPFAVVGEVVKKENLVVEDSHFSNAPVDLPMATLFKDLPRLQCQAEHVSELRQSFSTDKIDIKQAIKNVLQFPCVANKSFLITIGDRSVTGLVARDQMVGPWQVPVADVAVTCADYSGYAGEALAMGERTPIAVLHHAASARMAIGEAITNIAAAYIEDIKCIALSANWMAAARFVGDAAGLYDAVQTVGMEICPALGISIPVGKDSMSMRTEWEENGESRSVTSPLSLIISAAAKVSDVRKTLTPQLKTDEGETTLLLLDLGQGTCSMGASVLAQTQKLLGQSPADLDSPATLKAFFECIQQLNQEDLLLAYHDRSDGGLLATITEMMFAGHVGVDLCLDGLHEDPIRALFNEELGAVIQVRNSDLDRVCEFIEAHHLKALTHRVGVLNTADVLKIHFKGDLLFAELRVKLQQWWSETSYRMQSLRDHSECADQEYERITQKDPGLSAALTFDVNEDVSAPYLSLGAKPKVAILREQGVNGQNEMAAAFSRVGFDAYDVHMSELLSGQTSLDDFIGLAACGGFSYGDVLGAGRGWAQSILMHNKVRDHFAEFFARSDTFSLGVCNGCQMFSNLKEIIPGTAHWPKFHRNRSEQFEARVALLKVEKSPSIFLRGMEGSVIPVAVAHGEGRAVFDNDVSKNIALRYVDNHHQITEHYPENPNGSPQGITGLTSDDGRATILMPHPERVFRAVQMSWHPKDWSEDGPWLRFFANARVFVE